MNSEINVYIPKLNHKCKKRKKKILSKIKSITIDIYISNY